MRQNARRGERFAGTQDHERAGPAVFGGAEGFYQSAHHDVQTLWLAALPEDFIAFRIIMDDGLPCQGQEPGLRDALKQRDGFQEGLHALQLLDIVPFRPQERGDVGALDPPDGKVFAFICQNLLQYLTVTAHQLPDFPLGEAVAVIGKQAMQLPLPQLEVQAEAGGEVVIGIHVQQREAGKRRGGPLQASGKVMEIQQVVKDRPGPPQSFPQLIRRKMGLFLGLKDLKLHALHRFGEGLLPPGLYPDREGVDKAAGDQAAVLHVGAAAGGDGAEDHVLRMIDFLEHHRPGCLHDAVEGRAVAGLQFGDHAVFLRREGQQQRIHLRFQGAGDPAGQAGFRGAGK